MPVFAVGNTTLFAAFNTSLLSALSAAQFTGVPALRTDPLISVQNFPARIAAVLTALPAFLSIAFNALSMRPFRKR
ncbi:MAG: hypothetical protein Hens2KO_03790 [Henriciella sp.]